jgi:hypothetical protein
MLDIFTKLATILYWKKMFLFICIIFLWLHFWQNCSQFVVDVCYLQCLLKTCYKIEVIMFIAWFWLSPLDYIYCIVLTFKILWITLNMWFRHEVLWKLFVVLVVFLALCVHSAVARIVIVRSLTFVQTVDTS